MNEIKYEPVYGNQDLFDGASKDAVIAIKRPFISGVRSEEMYFFSSTFDAVMKAGSSFNFNNVILKTAEYAERRIIAEPKRWTVEDQKAGRLPDVGAKVDGGKVVFVNGFNVVTELKSGAVIVSSPKTFLNTFKPIETPDEKAQREEDEWVNKAWGETAVFAGVAQDEHDRLRIHLRHIYKAQLSGELQAPKGGE